MKKVLIQNQKGFTLIELMATVAIIGVLAAIAIPNYMKYQRKARQAEAKVLLGSAFLSEKAVNQDQHTYTGCLVEAGFGSDATNNFYMVGFGIDVSGTTTCAPYKSTNGSTNAGTGANYVSNGACNNYGWKADSAAAGTFLATANCAHAANGSAGHSYVDASQWLLAKPTITGTTGLNQGTVTSVSQSAFVVGAAGSISDTAGANPDVWQIDNNKTIYQTQDGTQ